MFQTLTPSITHRAVPVVPVSWTAPVAPTDGPTTPAFVRFAARSARTLPDAAYDALVDLGDDLDGVGAVVLRGLPVGRVPATPPHPAAPTDKDTTSELTLLTVARLLGQPVGYLPEHGGDLVQNIVPTSSDVARQTSTSSRVQLAFHTETAFHPHKPRFLVLLCLKGDPAASTTLCSIDDILPGIDTRQRQVLAEPRFHTRADESFGGGVDARFLPPMRVLTGDPDHPTLTFDAELTTGLDDEAQAALDALTALVEAHHTSLVLEAGDLLVVDNHRCVHGRSPFAARFDGTDRWLQRSFVVADLSASADDRVGRIITTTF